jgi:tetratricopeptide (TPR) repeat protein
MIVRDNETTIGPCLASIRPWVDEIVVVDTGSTDRTPEICREYGARMFDFAWCDDFSAARNESLKHARGEWIFWMDSDDTIPDECGRKLRALVDSLVAESLRDSAAASTDLQPRPSHGSGRATPPGRRTQLEGPKVHSTSAFLGYVMQVHCPGPGEEGAHDVTVVDHVKLLRNRPHLRFEGRIHEQLLPAIRRAGSEVAWTDIYVVHSGSDHSPDGFQRKLQRDLRILARELTERPDHPFVLFNLGMTYADAKRYDEAIDYLTRCIAVSTPDESHLRKAYALLVSSLSQADRHDEAWEMCQRGRALYRDDKELLFRLAMLQHHFGRLPEAEKSYLAVLYGNEERHFTSVDRQLAGNKARHNLAVVYDDMGLHEKSAAQWQAILDATRDYLPAWRGLAEALLKLGRYDCLVRLVEEMQSTPDLRLTGWTIQARLLERRGDLVGARRALESALHEVPDAVEPLQELCRFLFEHGEFDEAERALRRLTECSPGDASAWHNLGTIYCQLARYDEAAAAYRKSLAIRPNAEPTLQQLTFAVSRVERNMSPATSA